MFGINRLVQVTELRELGSALYKNVGEGFIVTRLGKPVACVVGVERYRALVDLARSASDPRLLQIERETAARALKGDWSGFVPEEEALPRLARGRAAREARPSLPSLHEAIKDAARASARLEAALREAQAQETSGEHVEGVLLDGLEEG